MIADLCRKYDVIVVSDEVYEWLVYPPRQHIRIGQCMWHFVLFVLFILLMNKDTYSPLRVAR